MNDQKDKDLEKYANQELRRILDEGKRAKIKKKFSKRKRGLKTCFFFNLNAFFSFLVKTRNFSGIKTDGEFITHFGTQISVHKELKVLIIK